MRGTRRAVLWVALVGPALWGCGKSHEAEVAPHVRIKELELRPFCPCRRGEIKRPVPAALLRNSLCTLRWVAFASTNFDP